MERTEDRVNELEDKTMEITRSEQYRENRLKKKRTESQEPVGLQ